VASISDLAALAQDIYDTSAGSTSGVSRGWARRDPMNWQDGFAAGTYSRVGETVVAFRGTEDQQDMVDDLLMMPVAQSGAARRTIEDLLRLYGVSLGPALDFAAPRLVEAVLRNGMVQASVSRSLNRVPTQQVRQALRYFDACQPRPRAVCGHSLGGALAQVVSQQRGVIGVSFNGPFMGDIAGAVPSSSGQLIYVNAIGDPLSFSTSSMGHVPHGQVHTVRLPAFPRRPAASAQPRWLAALSPALAMGLEVADTVRAYADILRYLGDTMLYHHSIDTLAPAVNRDPRFASPLAGTVAGTSTM